MKFKKAFTVVEVLMVIGIIAILTVIIFPSISNIRAKNRDTERVADVAALQLGLSLYYNQFGSYPTTTADLINLSPKYFPADALTPPTSSSEYIYVSLKRSGKCIYYQLGTKLELPSGQIDPNDIFTTEAGHISGGYEYCDPDLTNGINGLDPLMYSVHP